LPVSAALTVEIGLDMTRGHPKSVSRQIGSRSNLRRPVRTGGTQAVQHAAIAVGSSASSPSCLELHIRGNAKHCKPEVDRMNIAVRCLQCPVVYASVQEITAFKYLNQRIIM
jgi:hypothetical protein